MTFLQRIYALLVHSPVQLHIYDSLGNHVGYASDEVLELGFYALYFGDDEPQIALIPTPSSPTYDVILRGIGSGSYSLSILALNDAGNLINEWSFTGETFEGAVHYHTITTTATGELLAISWERVFNDPKRGTMLKISTDDKYFQFIAPGKDFGIKHDPNMRILRHVIIINYGDSQMRLIATAVDDCIGFCVATAWDRKTGKSYLLIDKPNPRGGSCNLLIEARLL
jgi:hypothetical protein